MAACRSPKPLVGVQVPAGMPSMVNKEKIQFSVDPLVEWIDVIMTKDPLGRTNNFLGKKKVNGAQHTIPRNLIFKPLYDKIDQIALKNFKSYIIMDVWTNINLNNGFNIKHTHVGADIAGCIYLKVPENSGDIEFDGGERITPVVGDCFWWDASIPHWVHKNETSDARYSIAFNIKEI